MNKSINTDLLKTLTIVILFLACSISKINAEITLKIKVVDLKNNSGFILMDFRNASNKQIRAINQKIENRECIITVNGLKAGKYSFKYFHDANNNKKIDKFWFGAPKEGYGFSNNAKGKLGAPEFEDTVFNLQNDTTIICSPTYVKL